jgi:hypothetical protein
LAYIFKSRFNTRRLFEKLLFLNIFSRKIGIKDALKGFKLGYVNADTCSKRGCIGFKKGVNNFSCSKQKDTSFITS